MGSDLVESLEIRLLPAATTLGDLFDVPSRIIGEQVSDSIATDARGNYTVVFSDNGLDSSGWGIYARRFAADSTPLGNQFRINSKVVGDQVYPSIATNRDGISLVVWRNDQYGAGSSLDLQFLNADGTLLGSNRNLIPEDNYVVHPGVYFAASTWGYSDKPLTFADTAGQFWVAVPVTDGTLNKSFQFWKVDPNGTPTNAFSTRLTAERSPADGTTNGKNVPSQSVALGADGTFYVIHDVEHIEAVPDVGQQFSSQLIVRRLSSSTGQAVGSDIVVHEAAYFDDIYRVEHRQPLVVPESGGKFSVLYYNCVGDLVTQHYGADGSKLGSLVKFIDHTELNPGYFMDPVSVSVLSNGNWLLVWDVPLAFDVDTSYTREFQTDGTPVGSAVELGTADYSVAIHLAPQPNDQFVVSWQDYPNSVYARRLAARAAVVTNKLVIIQQSGSGTVGIPLDQAVQVAVQDPSGNVISSDTSTVTLTVNSGPGGFANGDSISETVVNGIATFDNLIFDAAGSYILTATDGSLTAAMSTVINVTSAPVTNQLVIVQQPGSGTVGVPLGLALKVAVEDDFGNILSGNGSTVTLMVNSGPGDFANGSTLSVAAVNGVATFSNLILDAAGSYTLTATSGSLATTSTPISVTSAPIPNQLVIVQQPGSGTVGVRLGQAVIVALEDQAGNILSNDASIVTLTVTSGPGGFANGSTLSVAAVNGVATFSNLILDTAGNYTLTADSGSLTSAASAPISVRSVPVGPSITLSSITPVSTRARRAVVIDGSARFTSGLANLNLGQLSVSVTGARKGDGIVLPKKGQVHTGSRNQVFVNNVAIGTKSGSASNFKVTFNANATPDSIQALIENFSFTAAKKTTVGTRIVQFQLNDGIGGTATANKVIQVNN